MGNSILDHIYFIALPLFAAFSMGDYVAKDHTTGYVKQMFLHGGRKQYYLEKGICSFLVGALTVLIPLVVNILLNAAQFSSLTPMVESGLTPIMRGYVLSELYFSHPFIYILLFLFNICMYGGAFCVMSTAIGAYVTNPFIPLLFPFLFYLFEDSMLVAMQLPELSFEHLMILTRSFSPSYFMNLLGAVCVLAISALALVYAARKDETI